MLCRWLNAASGFLMNADICTDVYHAWQQAMVASENEPGRTQVEGRDSLADPALAWCQYVGGEPLLEKC